MAIGSRAEVMTHLRRVAGCATALGVLALGACVIEPDATTAMIPPPPPATVEAPPAPIEAPPTSVEGPPPTAPAPPPSDNAELVPPPPPGAGPMVWQPGHWDYTGMTGNPWSWHDGHYVPPPPGETTWVPGQWSQAPNGSWIWLHGHWA
jgi:hypothetical protein